jgi:hypothetical protein
MKGAYMRCQSCNHEFNLYEFYQSLYEDVPLAKQLVDVFVNQVLSAFRLDGGNRALREQVVSKLQSFGAQGIMERMNWDLLVFGNSFWRKQGSGSTLSLTQVNPQDYEMAIEWRQSRGQAYSEQITQLTQWRNGSTNLDANDLIRLSYNRISSPLGHSVYGLWGHMWYMVKTAPQALLNSSLLGGSKDVQAIKDYARQQVIVGSGVPFFLVTGENVGDFQRKFLTQNFNYDSRMRRDAVGRTFQYEILPLLAGQEWDYDRFPKVVWEKDEEAS